MERKLLLDTESLLLLLLLLQGSEVERSETLMFPITNHGYEICRLICCHRKKMEALFSAGKKKNQRTKKLEQVSFPLPYNACMHACRPMLEKLKLKAIQQ